MKFQKIDLPYISMELNTYWYPWGTLEIQAMHKDWTNIMYEKSWLFPLFTDSSLSHLKKQMPNGLLCSSWLDAISSLLNDFSRWKDAAEHITFFLRTCKESHGGLILILHWHSQEHLPQIWMCSLLLLIAVLTHTHQLAANSDCARHNHFCHQNKEFFLKCSANTAAFPFHFRVMYRLKFQQRS